MLDSRPLRTASKSILTIPHSKPHLAAAIALEWDLLVTTQQALKQHYVPLTSLTSRAIDISLSDKQAGTEGKVGRAREDIVGMMFRYLHTDTLLCWAPRRNRYDRSQDVEMRQYDQSIEGVGAPAPAETLREAQIRVAKPIISFLTNHIWPGIEIKPILGEDTIMPTPQPQMTKEIIRGWMSGLPAWELAGLERAVLASKSLCVGVRLLVEWSECFQDLRRDDDRDNAPRQGKDNQKSDTKFGIEEAAEASTLEVTWQTRMWGEVEDTHDVDKEDIRRQLGSVVLLVSGSDGRE